MTGDGAAGGSPTKEYEGEGNVGVRWGDETMVDSSADQKMDDEKGEGEVRFAMDVLDARSMSLQPEPFMIMRSKVGVGGKCS